MFPESIIKDARDNCFFRHFLIILCAVSATSLFKEAQE